MDLGGLKSEVKATITLFREQSDGSEGTGRLLHIKK